MARIYSKRRELLAAGIVRDIRFTNQQEYDIYIYGLKQKHTEFKVLQKYTVDNGCVLARIVQEYSTAPLIELYDD